MNLPTYTTPIMKICDLFTLAQESASPDMFPILPKIPDMFPILSKNPNMFPIKSRYVPDHE